MADPEATNSDQTPAPQPETQPEIQPDDDPDAAAEAPAKPVSPKPKATAQQDKPGSGSIKELITGLVIAFTMAFVFRGFVIEGFVIPTGSMAPTLLGKHIRIRDKETGYSWTVGPHQYVRLSDGQLGRADEGPPASRQDPSLVHVPMTGAESDPPPQPLKWGDRLFVLKYFPHLYTPNRWDVVVFKAPHVAGENYIKRLLGTPGEQIALVDGDVFFRAPGNNTDAAGLDTWRTPGWQIARKDERSQRAVWQTVFDSTYTPTRETTSFRGPWKDASGWEGLSRHEPSTTYSYTRSGATTLAWNDQGEWGLDDYTPYNELPASTGTTFQPWDRDPGLKSVFPCADIAASFGINPDDAGVSATAYLRARGMTFKATIADGFITLERAAGEIDPDAEPDAESPAEWTTIDTADFAGLRPSRVTNVEFWHVDQALWLFIDGKLAAGGPEAGAYDMLPAERAEAATGTPYEDLFAGRSAPSDNPLAEPKTYRKPKFEWQFSGGPFTLHRVAMQRDLFYQPRVLPGDRPARGAHPADVVTLSPDHFYLCGDNSASSLDGRYWDVEYPWVTSEIQDGESHTGLVHRHLIIGRAFIVYLPAPRTGEGIPMFDFGRVRWVW